MLAGNHDHGLIAGWIDARLQSEALGLPRALRAGRARSRPARSPCASASSSRPARLRIAYPGAWLRDDVYAHPRPLPRPALDDADVRAARGGRDGALGRPAARARTPGPTTTRPRSRRSTRSCTSSRSAPTTRRSARARARPRAPGSRSRGRGGRAIPSAPPRSAPATSARSALINALGLGPVDRDLSGSALRRGGLRGMREVLRRLGVDRAATCSSATPTAPGPWPQDDAAEWTTPAGSRLHQHRLVGLPAALPLRRAERVAVLARHRGRAGRRRAAAARPPARRPRPRGARPRARARLGRDPGGEAGGVEVTPAPGSSSSTPSVWRGCSTTRMAPGAVDGERPPVRDAARPGPRRTAHTAPAAYGPEYAPGWSAVCAGSSAPSSSPGRSGGDELALDAEQRLDLALGLLVGALAVVQEYSAPRGSHR